MMVAMPPGDLRLLQRLGAVPKQADVSGVVVCAACCLRILVPAAAPCPQLRNIYYDGSVVDAIAAMTKGFDVSFNQLLLRGGRLPFPAVGLDAASRRMLPAVQFWTLRASR